MSIANEVFDTHSFDIAEEKAIESVSHDNVEETSFLFEDGSYIVYSHTTGRFISYDYL